MVTTWSNAMRTMSEYKAASIVRAISSMKSNKTILPVVKVRRNRSNESVIAKSEAVTA
ncbi:MAG TPA: hypothetical protein VN739_09080 [Nitrososphaerales archaeon]|nr:hypothetical protein [Nitrososphaerales archaeon]